MDMEFNIGDTVLIKPLGRTGEIIAAYISIYRLVQYEVEYVGASREIVYSWHYARHLKRAVITEQKDNVINLKS